jgi:mRNA interferase MazF
VVQCDELNQSRVNTVVCVPLTTNLKWADAPGNVMLSPKATGLFKDSVANASLIVALDRRELTECVGKLPRRGLELVLAGIDTVLGR